MSGIFMSVMRLGPKPRLGRALVRADKSGGEDPKQIPEWIMLVGGIAGSVIAMIAIQKVFPRKVNIVHKDEHGNIIK